MADKKQYSESQRRYNDEYRKVHTKRVPLDMQLDQYEALKAGADAVGESVNGFIKNAIKSRLNDLEVEWPEPTGQRGRKKADNNG